MTAPATARGGAIAAVIGALIGAFFGRVWLGLAANALPAWRTEIGVVGWAVLGVFVVAAVFVARGTTRMPPQWAGVRPRKAWPLWLGVAIAAEVALIAGGHHLFKAVLARPECIPAWTLFVVGAHFWPFAVIFRMDAFRILSGALCAAAVFSAIAASVAGVESLWSVLPGFGGAAALWGFSGWALHLMARTRRMG